MRLLSGSALWCGVLLLSACGGGGGSSGGGSGVVSTPTPKPPPVFTPTASTSFTPSTARRDYYKLENGQTAWPDYTFSGGPSPRPITIAYDAGTGLYTLDDTEFSVTLDAASRTASGNFDVYTKAGTSGTDTIRLYRNARSGADTSGLPVQLSYASFGNWLHEDAASTHLRRQQYFVFGYPTASGSMPTSGTATYTGTARGEMVDGNDNSVTELGGTMQLVANFGTSALTTSLALTNAVNGTAYRTFEGTAAISGSSFSGSFQKNGFFLMDSSFAGGFYGPQAKEAGYAFSIYGTTRDIYSGASVIYNDVRIVGAAAGAKP